MIVSEYAGVERLWAPWRMSYVAGEKRDRCIFCTALEEGDSERLILHRGEHAFIILNLYPYNSGHSMVVPIQHVADLEHLDPVARAEMFELTTLATEASRRVLRCDGFNVGMNIGEIAGAGVAEHLHLHVVPRWLGDANFMPIVGNTMVMPELLPVTYARLRAEIEGIIARREPGVEIQAGAIVVLPQRGVAVLRRTRTGNIGLPKGHVEPGEALAQTAMREVREETGIAARIVGWAGTTTYNIPDDSNRRYVVTYFIAAGEETEDTAHHLDTDTLLVPIEDAAARIDISGLQSLVKNVTPIMLRLQQQGTE